MDYDEGLFRRAIAAEEVTPGSARPGSSIALDIRRDVVNGIAQDILDATTGSIRVEVQTIDEVLGVRPRLRSTYATTLAGLLNQSEAWPWGQYR